jgi:hypothetical protein
MNPENPGENGNIIDFGQARRKREGVQDQEKEGFITILQKYAGIFNELILGRRAVVEEELESEEEKVVARRQIEIYSAEISRLTSVLARYYSYGDYAKKIESILESFRSEDEEVKMRANKGIQEMTGHLREFARVFEDYEVKDEKENVRKLIEKLRKGFEDKY